MKFHKNSSLAWADKLRARKNPFLAHSSQHGMLTNLGYGMGAAAITSVFNKFTIDKLPSQFHIPAHGALSLSTLILPKGQVSAAFAGAVFYAFFSETYYSVIKSSLLQTAKNALK